MTGLLLFSHGSVIAGAGEALTAHAARLKSEHGFPLVEVGYLNYSEPSFAEGVARLTCAGAERIVVVPFFLAPGYFVTNSLPQCIETVKPNHPKVEFIAAESLGVDNCLADAVIESALATHTPKKSGQPSALLVMVHGSPQMQANEPMFQVVHEVRRRAIFPIVEVGFMECNEPTITDAIATCVRHGARKIVAVPYFLHLGAHVTEDLPALIVAAGECYTDVEFAMGEYIGKSAKLTPLLAQRGREALAAHAAARSDTSQA